MERQTDKKYSDKHGPGEQPDETIKAAVMGREKNGMISCAEIFKIAGETGALPADVGKTTDLLDIRLSKCQLGLFGYQPEKKIVKPVPDAAPEISAAIRDELVDGVLPCRHAWGVASRFGVPKMRVSGICEAMGVKIKPCQLGAF
jgi:hypothetical protein